MKILERELGTLTYQASQTRTLQLPRNYAYRKIYLKLVAQIDIAAGASAGTPKDSAPGHLVQSIEIRANGRDVIKKLDLATLHRLNQIRYGVRPRIQAPPTGFAEAVDEAMDIHAIIDFEMWRAIRPIDTLLDSASLATFDMIVTFAAPNDIMTGAFDGTVTVDSATLYAASLESVGVPQGTKFMVNKEYTIQSVITAASTNHQITLPVGNLFRCFVIKTYSDDIQVDTILNNIQLKSGTEVYKNRIANFLQRDNRVEYGIEVPELDGSAAAVDHYFLEHLLEGYYVLDFVKDGHLTECLDTRKLSSLELVLDVNHPGTTDIVEVYPVEILMPAVQKV